ncbi:MAG: cob(I)yrinic acid a,c-diamide adenosyltransferase [Gammaproteobacteria bacterium]|nr:cob(I)yrinic acid a,c-diamide adenosyltransferase [Gammaproteobacteria bacterium]
MGHRLSKIVTRTGDDGTTGLGDGSRVKKTDRRIEAIGAVDELNSLIGMLIAREIPDEIRTALTEIQHDLFDLGGDLSIPGRGSMTDAQIGRLDTALEKFNARLSPLKEFILPGGSETAAICHVTRSVCRRAERDVWHLGEAEKIGAAAAKYLNRLSDLLFVLARVLNVHAGRADVLWQPGKNR